MIISIVVAVIQVLSTIALVIITYKQIKLAANSVESMDRSMKADFLPILMLGIEEFSSTDTSLNIRLINCGKGIAIKPRVIFPGQADIVLNSININESGNARISYTIDYVLTKVSDADRKITIEYRDVFNRKIVTEANLIEVNRLGTTVDQHGISWDTWTPIIP